MTNHSKKNEGKKNDVNENFNLSSEEKETLHDLKLEMDHDKIEEMKQLGTRMFEAFKKSNHMLIELQRQLRFDEKNPVSILIVENEEILKRAEEIEKLAAEMQK